jgi:hypothetical protein
MATLLPIPSEAPVMRTVCKASDKAGLIERLHTYLALDIELVCAGEHDDRGKDEHNNGDNGQDAPVVEAVICCHDEGWRRSRGK